MGTTAVFTFRIEHCAHCYGGREDHEGGERVGLLVPVKVLPERGGNHHNEDGNQYTAQQVLENKVYSQYQHVDTR